MAQSPPATKMGRTGFSRPIVVLASVAVLMIVLVLLLRVNDDESSATSSSNVPTQSESEQCIAGGVDCSVPPLELCVNARGVPVDCSAVLADAAQSESSTSMGEWLLVGAVVLAPFALVLGPLGWRAVRRTRRRNIEAFEAGLADVLERGFDLVDDPRPERFVLQQACQRAQRVLVREGNPRVWLFERERTISAIREAWPVRSAVVELATPVPTMRLVPVVSGNGGTRRYRNVSATDAGEVLQRVLDLLEEAFPNVVAATTGDLLEVHTPPRVKQSFEALIEPLSLSAVADLADAIATALVAHASEPSA